jgi:uncharacterized protein with FMN-binding domain
MPKRGVIAFVTTILMLGLLLSFKTPDTPTTASSPPGVIAAAPTAGANGVARAPVPTARTNAGQPAIAPPTAGATKRPGTTPAPTPAATPPAATPPAPPAATPPPATGDGQLIGPVISTRFGPVQVEVTLQNGAIVDVSALELPTGRRSGQISNEAAPILHDEVLQAQSASIDIVSGATYTSDAYARSLQAAHDKANG